MPRDARRPAAPALLATLAGLLALVLPAGPAAAHGGPGGSWGAEYHLANGLGGASFTSFVAGRPGDEVYVGDWDGDGRDTLALRRGATFHVFDGHRGGAADVVFTYGSPADDVVVGDWDGNGTDTLAVRRGATYHLRNALAGGVADVVVRYGLSADGVLVGDWDGDGRDTLALRRGRAVHVKNSLGSGSADVTFAFGSPYDQVLAGDWTGSGRDTLAVRRGGTWHARSAPGGGAADIVFAYGAEADSPLVGDWDGDGRDSPGVQRPARHPVWLPGTVTDVRGVVSYSGSYDARNGRLAPSVLCLVPFLPGHYVHCRALGDLVAFHRAYAGRFGERLPIDSWDRSTYRSLEGQVQTWQEIGPPIAARPGTSPHGWGMAVDMFEGSEYDFGSARYAWMLANGPRFGWRNMPWHQRDGSVPEYWHFDYVR